MTQIDKTKPVMITGATGYVAGRIVEKLLEDSITVHAPVRDPEDADKLKYLNALAEKLPGSIKYFKADLLEEGSYKESMEGCELVFHTASPFIRSVDDPQRNLVDPALNGTRNVLNSVNDTPSVKRVVLTSSCAAIIGDAKDCLAYPNGTATEEHWNSSSSLTHEPYSYSKTIAEKEAWKINKAQNRWDMTIINPSLVLGPGINPNGTSESYNIVKQMGDGSFKTGAPEFYIGAVDVRDVAEAHIQAGFRPDAEGRHIVSAEETSFLGLAVYLRKAFGEKYPFPKRKLPKFLVWLVAPAVGLERKSVARGVGYHWRVDNTKSKEKLGINYRSVEDSVVEFFGQLVENGVFEK